MVWKRNQRLTRDSLFMRYYYYYYYYFISFFFLFIIVLFCLVDKFEFLNSLYHWVCCAWQIFGLIWKWVIRTWLIRLARIRLTESGMTSKLLVLTRRDFDCFDPICFVNWSVFIRLTFRFSPTIIIHVDGCYYKGYQREWITSVEHGTWMGERNCTYGGNCW